MAAKKSGGRTYGKAAGKSVKRAMHRRKTGALKRGKAGHGGTVTSRKQAIAIGLAEAREDGAKVPARKRGGAKKSTAKKSTAKKSTAKKSTAKRSSTKRASTKKSTSRKSTSKRSTGRKAASKRSR